MRKVLVGVVAVSALLWAALWLVPQVRTGSAAPASATPEPEAAAPSVTHAAVAAKLPVAAAKPSPAGGRGTVSASKPEPAAVAGPHNLTEDGRRLNAKALTLHRAFKLEKRDPVWAKATEKRLTEYTAKFKLGDHEVESIECLASICRLQFAVRGEKYDRRIYMLSRAMERMFSKNYALEPLAEVGGVNRMVVWTSRHTIEEQQASLQASLQASPQQ